VLTAALDVARLGGRAPLPADLLRAAAPGYCTSVQQAEAPGGWFERALAYATEKLHGAAAALSPAGAGVMGQVAGYTVADYLLQHATRERIPARVPASTWDAILSYVREPADAVRLADSARNRRLYQHAIPLYRRAADGGDWYVAVRLDGLLAERGDLEGLRARADAGDLFATARLTELLAERGDVDELRAQADAGDKHAAVVLAGLLAERGDVDELRARADAGDLLAALELADLLAERGDLDELRARADAGDDDAAARLDELLAERGDLDELRARADAGDSRAASWVPDLLAERGDLDEPRTRADAGDRYAAAPLAEILLETLAHFRWPQNAGFLEEYLLAKHRLQVGSRAFAPLRRDERKAWDRAPGAREAYIAPALKPDGSANPRWITRSDWDLERRIVATPRTERLVDLYKIYVLAGRPGSAEAIYLAPRTPADALLEKYAHDILDTEPPPTSASNEEFRAWRAQVRERAGIAIGEIRREDEPDRKQIARQLAGLSDHERIWGRT
jgi:hypothetical protein